MSFFNRISQIGFSFGTKVVPRILKAVGIPVTKKTVGHGSLWTGALLAVGGVLIIASTFLGIGGAIFAPSLLGAILISTVGVAVGAVGKGLYRAAEHNLGFSIKDKVKGFFGFKAKPVVTKAQKTPPQIVLTLPTQKDLLGMAKRLADQFKDAVNSTKLRPATPPRSHKIAFNGVTI